MEQVNSSINIEGESQDKINTNSTDNGLVNRESFMPTELLVDDGQMNDNPLIAADEDLIEKEWVDRAKKIVQNTEGNPYRQDEEVSDLQADYLEKRYSKKIGSS